mgnify:FL=1
MTCTVAGISRVEKGGLWVELSPGRIVEVPAPLLVWKNNGKERPLLNFFWEAFAPGDKVTFQLIEETEDDLLKPERIGFLNWVPGIRKALGIRRCFLPVHQILTEVGALEVGTGLYSTTLPVDKSEATFKEIVLLYEDNRIKPVDSLPKSEKQLKGGDVAFLTWDDASQFLTIIGFESLKPLPVQTAKFWKDSFSRKLVQYRQENWRINLDKFKTLTKLLSDSGKRGGLPITIEHTDLAKNTVYFSLRHQTEAGQREGARPLMEQISLANIVGLWPDSKMCLLQCGSGLMTLEREKVIPGLPESVAQAANAAMSRQTSSSRSNRLIGLHRTKSETAVGFSQRVGDELSVEVIATVLSTPSDSSVESDLDSGIICRSTENMRFYWLPA